MEHQVMEQQADIGNDSDGSVLELLDRVLNTGVVLVGDIAITVADIELLYLRLQVLVSSAETARRAGWLASRPALPDRRICSAGCNPHYPAVTNRS